MHILVATDSEELADQVEAAALGSMEVQFSRAYSGPEALNMVAELSPDLVVCDFQIGAMGGVAVVYDLKLEIAARRIPKVPIILLLDREVDVFLTKEAGADGWVLKPIDSIRLREVAEILLNIHSVSLSNASEVMGG